VLLLRPHAPGTETVNDLDCYVANFWRAVAADPEAVARYADWPVIEADQHARHQWLVDQAEFRERMNTDPDYYDPKVAGWWVWGLSVHIGDGWCDSRFWRDPRQLQHVGDDGNGVHRPIPHVGGSGRGVNRKIMPLGDSGKGVNRSLPHLSSAGMGVNRKLPNLSTFGGTRQRRLEGLVAWMEALADRLRFVRVCCGDWTRVLTPSVTTKIGLTGVLLDPPYLSTKNQEYAVHSDGVAEAVAAWAAEHGDDPLFRIALCGYEGDYTM